MGNRLSTDGDSVAFSDKLKCAISSRTSRKHSQTGPAPGILVGNQLKTGPIKMLEEFVLADTRPGRELVILHRNTSEGLQRGRRSGHQHLVLATVDVQLHQVSTCNLRTI